MEILRSLVYKERKLDEFDTNRDGCIDKMSGDR